MSLPRAGINCTESLSGITSWTQLLHCQYNYTLTAKLPTQRKCVPTESLQRHILQPKASIFDVAASNN